MPIELTKEDVREFAFHHWYQILIVILILASAFLWWKDQEDVKKFKELQAKVTITEEIAKIEARLNAMKEREKQYLDINAKQEELNKALVALEDQRRKLEQIKKERIMKDVQKLDINGINSEFNKLGITGIIER